MCPRFLAVAVPCVTARVYLGLSASSHFAVPFQRFSAEYKELCKTDLVHVDDSGVAMKLSTVFNSGDVEHIIIAPIAAIHHCSTVSGSLDLRDQALAFYMPFVRSKEVQGLNLEKTEVVDKLLQQGVVDKCSLITEFRALIDLLVLVKHLSYHPLHEFYVLGLIHRATEGNCNPGKLVRAVLLEYLMSQASDKASYDRVSRVMSHNFFSSVDSSLIDDPGVNNKMYLLQLLKLSFPEIQVVHQEHQVEAERPIRPSTHLPLIQGDEEGMRFRLMVANDGKLAGDGSILNFMLRFARHQEVDVVLISEGTISDKSKIDPKIQSIAKSHDFKVILPKKTQTNLVGGVGLAFRTGLERFISDIRSPSATGFDIGVIGVKNGVRLAALYTSPTHVDEKGRAIEALKKWSIIANALMSRSHDEEQLEHESIVAGDMNAASGTYQRIVFDSGMEAMGFKLLNRGLMTYRKGHKAEEKDIDLIYATSGVSVISDFEVTRSARVNDHARIVADFFFRKREVLPLYVITDLNAGSAEKAECATPSCFLDAAATKELYTNPYELAKKHVVENFQASPDALRSIRRDGTWSGRIYATHSVVWPYEDFKSFFTQEEVSNAVDWLFKDCLSCHQLPDLADKEALKIVVMNSLSISFRNGHMVDELAAPVLERLLSVKLKKLLDSIDPSPLNWSGTHGCSSWKGRHLEDEQAELALSLLVRVMAEEAIKSPIQNGKASRELLIASVVFDQSSAPSEEALNTLAKMFEAQTDLFRVIRTFLDAYKATSFSLVRNLSCFIMASALSDVSKSFGSYSLAVKGDKFVVSDAVWGGGMFVFAEKPELLKLKLEELAKRLKIRAKDVDIMSYPGVVNVDVRFYGVKHQQSESLRLPFGIRMLQANPSGLMISERGPESIISEWQKKRMFLSDQEDKSARFRFFVNHVVSDVMRGSEVSLQSAKSYSRMSNLVISSMFRKESSKGHAFSELALICASSIKGHPAYILAVRLFKLVITVQQHPHFGALFSKLIGREWETFSEREKATVTLNQSKLNFFERVFWNLFRPLKIITPDFLNSQVPVEDRVLNFKNKLDEFYQEAISGCLGENSARCRGSGVRDLQLDEVTEFDQKPNHVFEALHEL